MTAVIGDIVAPQEFLLPPRTTTEIDSLSAAGILSGAMFWNTTLGKIDVYTGVEIETVTSVAR